MKCITDWMTTPTGAMITMWLLVGVFTFLFKKRTPEEYAASAARHPVWFWSRVTALWQFLAGIGPDPHKIAEAVYKMVTGRVAPLALGIVAGDVTKPSVRLAPGGGSVSRTTDQLPVIHLDDDDDTPPSTKPEAPAAKRSAVRFMLFMCLVAFVLVVVVGCASAAPAPSDGITETATQRSQRAEREYGAELQTCVIKAALKMPDKTDASKRTAREDADACAALVRQAWGIDGGAPPTDAGALEGGAR